jgi:hypothetical protein
VAGLAGWSMGIEMFHLYISVLAALAVVTQLSPAARRTRGKC